MTLVLYPEGRAHLAVRVESPEFVVGRAADADWMLEGPCVSRRHLVIRRLDGVYLVEDVSRNGSHLNGVRLEQGQPATLRAGDRLRIDTTDIVVAERVPEARVEVFDTTGIEVAACADDLARWLPEPIPERCPLPVALHGAEAQARIVADRARELFDALLGEFEPARFESGGTARWGPSARREAWGRYHRHFRRIQVDPDGYFRRLMERARRESLEDATPGKVR